MFKTIRRFVDAELIRFSRAWRRRRAQQLLKWYDIEVEGAGLRWRYELMPHANDLEEKIAKNAARDAKEDRDRFRKRIDGFRDMHAFLVACRDIAVVRPNPWSYMPNTSEFVTREIDDDMIDFTRQMYIALSKYSTAIREHEIGCGHGEIEKAARAVAAVINPNEWREAGYPAPDSVVDGAHGRALGLREYLVATVAD